MTTSIFVRDRFTWRAYFMLAYYAYLQAALGPLMPFLRQELGLSYTAAGLHLSAFAVGMIVAGLMGERLARRWGRAVLLWAGAMGMAAGALALVFSAAVTLTVGSVLAMGVLGGLLLAMIQATLSDRHGDRRATALTEANVAAGLSAALAPLAVGGFERLGAGWRWALIVAALAIVLAAAGNWARPAPPARRPLTGGQRMNAERLPLAFWVYWVVLLLVVSVEWCVIFWGAEFLETVAGLPKVMAATLMTVFWVAYVIGRLAGSRLTLLARPTTLLLAALGIGLVAFPLLWLGPLAALNVVGLFIVGLGLANLYPLTMAAAMEVAPQQANAASARISLGAGLAILTAPLALGGLADQIGLRGAYGVVAALLLAAVAVTWLANRLVAAQG